MIPTNQNTVSGFIWTNESVPYRLRLNDRAGRDDLIIQFFKDRLCQQSSLRGNETRPDLQTGGEICTVPSNPTTGCCEFFNKCFLFQYKNISVTFALFNT